MHCECSFMFKKSEVNLPLTGSVIRALHVVGRKFPLAEGNTLMSCSKGLNCRWIMMTLCKSGVNTSGTQGQNKITHNRVCVTMQCVSNYRFGPFLEIAEHALDVFEVGGKRSIMKGKIPLPGCATLWQIKKPRHSETVCRTTQRQVKYIFSYFNQKCSILKDLQPKSFLRPLPLALSMGDLDTP